MVTTYEEDMDYKENDNGWRKVSDHPGIEEIIDNDKKGLYNETYNIDKVSDNQGIDQIIEDDKAGYYAENDKG